jgi:hypothetical protein
MTTMDRITVTMPPEVGAAVREAARRKQVSVSSWLTSAAEDKLRNLLLRQALDAWEAEDGPLTDEELQEARRVRAGGRRRSSV